MPRILVVDDEPGIRQSLSGVLADEGYAVDAAASGEDCLAMLLGGRFELVLLDIWLPGLDGMEVLSRIQEIPLPERPEVVVISGHGSIEAAVKATKLGAFDFLEKPLSLERVLVVAKNALDHRSLTLENSQLKGDPESRYRIIGESVPMKALRQQLSLMAGTNGRVLIFGESGVGKELVAHALHAMSPRAALPFVEVNCAAIPEELIESELFGHVKGAFTGAIRDQKGKFREAHGGTLFLDEVGDMSLKTQAKVLRALQEGRIEPVGGGGAVSVDVRVIAATNKDLQEEIKTGRFREDLYFRLAVVPLRLPPLRERTEELIPMAEAFLQNLGRAHGRAPKRLSEDARATLLRHDWPGNVRELKNLMERALILGRGSEITTRDLGPLNARFTGEADPFSFPEFSSLKEARDWFEVECIKREVRLQSGNMTRVAERLGLDRSNLYKRLKALGVEAREP
jgi:two-component system nitrogen regulation response regulator NtrX